ncbi:hypothetical protein [Streptomyces sp. NPDC002994]|uniref:hypothetical protein n=1 Tax=Streptomyces sp. NPDC002994 TaxID=3154441 RepID=UPI0033B94535
MASADWRITVTVENAGGAPVAGARLTRSIWAGAAVQRLPEVTLSGATFTFVAPEAAQSIVCELRHARYAALAMALVRNPGERVWRWTNSTRRVGTTGSEVTVTATLGRVRPAPLGHIPETELTRRASAHQARLDEADRKNAEARRRGRPPTEPNFVPLDLDHRTALTTQDRTAYRTQARIQRVISGFHVATPELLSETTTAPGWTRFTTTLHTVDPNREGRLYLVEYGEVGDDPSPGPRFAVGVWVPQRLHDPRTEALDFVVWLHPHTNNRLVIPQVGYPFRQPYPYGIVAAKNVQGNADAAQRFIDIPVFHLLSQHFLAYQLAAARRAAVIVIPVAPSSHFEPFESPATLMRLLRELCLWIPRDFPRGAEAAVHRPQPAVGRVVVSAFSSSVPRLHTLMNGLRPDSRYDAPFWWTTRQQGLDDVADFRRVWKEQWAVDGIASGFLPYVDAAASWVQQTDDRRLRIYKSRFTGGWDPAAPRPGAWGTLVKGATVVRRGSGDVSAVKVTDARGWLQAVSFTDSFLLGPERGPEAAFEPPLLPNSAHEMMPRICFGHAAVTSGLASAD